MNETLNDSDRFAVSGWEDDLADIDDQRNPAELSQREILKCCEDGNLARVEELLKEHPELISVKDKDQYTPLHRACYSNNVEIVKYLVKNGADISAKTEMGWEPLHSCCQWNHVDCAKVLIQNGANVNALSEGGQTPLHVAASHGASYEMVQILLFHPNINPQIKNKNNETAYDIAKRSSKFYNIFEAADPILDISNLELLK